MYISEFRERKFENAVGDTISFTFSIFKRGTGSLFTLENQSVCAIMGGGFGREQSMGGTLAEPLRVNSRGCEQIHLGKRFHVSTPDLLEGEA